MYKVVTDFKDLRDGGHQYKKGDVYPHAGKADEARVSVLMTPTTQRGALIEFVADGSKEKPESVEKKTSKK